MVTHQNRNLLHKNAQHSVNLCASDRDRRRFESGFEQLVSLKVGLERLDGCHWARQLRIHLNSNVILTVQNEVSEEEAIRADKLLERLLNEKVLDDRDIGCRNESDQVGDGSKVAPFDGTDGLLRDAKGFRSTFTISRITEFNLHDGWEDEGKHYGPCDDRCQVVVLRSRVFDLNAFSVSIDDSMTHSQSK